MNKANARSWAALGLSAFAALGALLLLSPILARWMWIARLAFRETSLIVSASAALAWALARRGRGGKERLARRVAVPAAVLGLVPFVAQSVVLARLGLPFSFLEYLRGPRHAAVGVERDVVLESRSPAFRADIYRAPGPGPHPFVVAIHGGSWRGGTKGQGAHISRALAAAGHTVVDVEYGLAPAHPFPEGIGDVKCLLGRLRARASELGLDPRRAVLLGRSAGGQIALLAAYSSGDPRIPPTCGVEDEPVQGVIALYAPVDLVYGHANPMRPDVVRGTESLELYLGGPPTRRLEAYRLASPRSWVDRPLPPTLLLHGASDPIVECLHSVLLASELHAAGKTVQLVCVPFGEHAFDMRPGSVGEQLARGAILGFLRRT
jgi:acetyl esterase/lipase